MTLLGSTSEVAIRPRWEWARQGPPWQGPLLSLLTCACVHMRAFDRCADAGKLHDLLGYDLGSIWHGVGWLN